MYKGIKIGLIVIGLISAVLWFMLPDQEDPSAASSGALNGMFWVTYILLAVSSVMAIVFGISKMLSTPGGLKKTLYAVVALAVLFVIGYIMSSGEEAEAVVNTFKGKDIEPTVATVKNIGMLLNVFFGMTLIAVVLMVVPGLKKLIGK